MQKGYYQQDECNTLLKSALAETDDSIIALAGGGLHPDAVAYLQSARRSTENAISSGFSKRKLAQQAIREQKRAQAELIH
jgi:hypothetical protein